MMDVPSYTFLHLPLDQNYIFYGAQEKAGYARGACWINEWVFTSSFYKHFSKLYLDHKINKLSHTFGLYKWKDKMAYYINISKFRCQ